ncbi:MAG: AraC family transcriptional regulator [Paenibacillus sp.]|jgi:AraC-like DNA-binding protein|nr:AraC family transcriptional regulator [Paenibacillus sp.]
MLLRMDTANRELLREARIHGDVMFPIGAYLLEAGPGEPVLTCHWHEEAEFFYVIEGKTVFQVDTEYFEVKAGEAVFIHGGEIHAGYAVDSGSACKFAAVVFDLNLLNSSTYDALQSRYLVPLQEKARMLPSHIRGTEPWEQNVLRSVTTVFDAYSRQLPGYELVVKAHLYLILSEIEAAGRWVQRGQASSADSGKIDRLKHVLSYIQANYDQRLRIKDLADRAHMSEGQFCRFFKSMTRKTPIEYINAYRVNQAASLLKHGNQKIVHVAMDVGFDNLSYFIKVFREQMNCTPSEYRKEQR